jgi:hypothetical protein
MQAKKYLIVLVVILVTACSGLNVKNQADKLRTALDDYGAALRWGRYNHAYVFHIDQQGKQPEVDLNALEKYSVTAFRPVDPVLNEDATEATIPVEIDYYDEQYGTLKKFKYIQKWWFNAEIKRWLIASDFPIFE